MPDGSGAACPEHGPPEESHHRFCEVCGRNLMTPASAAPGSGATPPGAPVPVAPVPGVARWLSSRASSDTCGGCGTTQTASGTHCEHCGRRRSPGGDRAERDLGRLAGVTDRARRRRNEDAFAIGTLAGSTIGVVCDGVSTSARADTAAHAAVDAAMAAILTALADGAGPEAATAAGARLAAESVRAEGSTTDGEFPPSCTYVSAIVTAAAITIGWIGDSRAYWLGSAPPDASRLTIDDSVVGRLTAGLPVPDGAAAEPNSRALIRWLGADSDDSAAQIVFRRPTGPGRLVLCSDGLSHYLSEPAALAAALAGAGPEPLAQARHLTRVALDSGGHDNVAVVVMPFPPSDV